MSRYYFADQLKATPQFKCSNCLSLDVVSSGHPSVVAVLRYGHMLGLQDRWSMIWLFPGARG